MGDVGDLGRGGCGAHPVENLIGVSVCRQAFELNDLGANFDVLTEDAKKSKMLVIEVINLRKDGSVDGDAPFGDFVVNRIGYHVWYKKK